MRSSQSDASGFALVVLMVILGMIAVWMTASLPAWKHNATREKEAELVFRGQQYVRALNLYQKKFGPGSAPQSLDVLYDNKLLRKKYKDPITNDDFLPLYRGNTAQGPGGQSGGGNPQPTGPGQGSALMGVQSKSTAASILVYNGATHYNEWQFITTAQQPQQGGPGRGPGGPGGPARGGGPGGPVRGGGPGRGQDGLGPGRGGPGGPGRGGPPAAPGPGRGRGSF